MRRLVLSLLGALVAVASLAAPASAGGTTDIIVGAHDGTFVVETVPTATVASALSRAERDPEVAWVEVDHVFDVARVPDDTHYGQQWGVRKVQAPEAWDRTTGDPSIVVAVVDTGVDATHPDLAGAVLPGADFVDDGRTGDPAGHGTGVAGVIAARGDNGIGIAGYCWTCRILPVRVLDADGAGHSSDIAAGVRWATDNGADIINLSLSGENTSVALELAIAAARAKGIPVVAAAGNRASSRPDQVLTVPQYPAASSGVIGVVATTDTDAPYSWSFRGTWADLAAPGCVVTTKAGGGYRDQCGTSFAAPAVAGTLALALGGFPVPAGDAELLLLSSAVPLVAGIAERGRLDAGEFLDAVADDFPLLVTPERVAGTDRIGTAVALSTRSFDDADTVVLARSDRYHDALLAAPLAGQLGAPVLLTSPAGLHPSVADEIRRLGASSVRLVGGTDALSAAVVDQLHQLGVTDTPRIAGVDVYDRAARLAAELGGRSVYVAQVDGWPDAVAVSALAARTHRPILLVARDAVPAATAQALAALQADEVTLVGGTAVISPAVEAALAAPGRAVRRLQGVNRYETARAVATAAVADGADAARTWFATGVDWPDALAAGPAVAVDGGTLLLIDGRSTSGTPAATSWLAGVVGGLRQLVVVGGEAAVTAPALALLAGLLGS